MSIQNQDPRPEWEARLTTNPILPVVKINQLEHALPLADALLEAGFKSCEIVLRSEAALGAIERIASQRPELFTGAGTIVSPDQVAAASDAGAQFCISPGLSEEMVTAAADAGLPLIPGVATASEILLAQRLGLGFLKFFPAEAQGGPAWLEAMAAVFPDVRFCPTGGIRLELLDAYLKLSNTPCVGGSWFVSAAQIEKEDWEALSMGASMALMQAEQMTS